MSEQEETKVIRPRLTITAILEAVEDMYLSTLPENDQDQVDLFFDLRKSTGIHSKNYQVRLFRHVGDQDVVEVLGGSSQTSYENAAAELLEKVRDLLELRKKEILAALSSVSDRHRATIRGARKKAKAKTKE